MAVAAVVLMGAEGGACGGGTLDLRHSADSEIYPYKHIFPQIECWEWETPYQGKLVTFEIDNRRGVSSYYVADFSGRVIGRTRKIDCKDVKGSRTVVLPDGGSVRQTRYYRGRLTWPCQMWPILPDGRCIK